MQKLPKSVRIGVPSNGLTKPENFFVEVLNHATSLDLRPNLYGSDAGYCPRKNFFYAKLEGQSEVFSATNKIYMGIGNGIEEVLAESLEQENRLFFTNLYLPPMEPIVRGKIDFVYLNENNQIAIAELKTCGQLPTSPKPNHLAQLATYSAVAGYDICNLIYISRNVTDPAKPFGTLAIKVFPVKFSFDEHVETLAKIVMSERAIQNEIAPPIPNAFYKTTTCSYCPFTDICWGEKENPFPEMVPGQLTKEWIAAKEIAEGLAVNRKARYIASLRHLYRNIDNQALKNKLIQEVELFETF